jgi:circadian clock protein KaiC
MDRVDAASELMPQLSTGVASLDKLMGGGIPEQSVTVLTGSPGTGKTVLAMQMMFHQARLGKRCIYFTTLSEPPLKVIRYMRLFSFFDESLVDDLVSFVDLGTPLLNQGAEGAVAVVQEHLESEEPDFVVFDSFKAIHDLIGPDVAASRRVAYELSVMLAGWGTTTLLLGEYTDADVTLLPEFAIADGIVQVSNQPHGLTRLRELEVQKLRGADYTAGRHFFEIHPDGVAFYPRMRGLTESSLDVWSPTKVPTGVPGLDELCRGGLPSGSTTLIEGCSGTGKSTIAMRFLVEGAERGEPGVHFGLEERPAQIRGVSSRFGWDLAAFEAQALLTLSYTSPVELNADRFLGEALHLIRQMGAKRVVLDSTSALAMGLETSGRFRELFYALATHLREEGVTALLTAEIPELLGSAQLTGRAVSSIADNVILLRYVELAGRLDRAISVLKMRGSEHGTELRRMSIGATGPSVEGAFPSLRGVLTGELTQEEKS